MFITLLAKWHIVASEQDWSEGHRPTTTEDMVGNSEAIGKIRAWLNKWSNGQTPDKRGMLLIGPLELAKPQSQELLHRTMGGQS